MRASALASSALHASCSLAALLSPSPSISDPTITPAPTIPIELLRRQNNDRFIGWISESGSWTSDTCEVGGTYYQSGDYWRCCATTLNGCDVPLGCVGGSLIYSLTTGTQSFGTYACTEVYTDPAYRSFTICNTGFMYENSQDSDPATNIFCGRSSVNWSYFRVLPTDAITTKESSSEAPTTRSSTTPSSRPTFSLASPDGGDETSSATSASTSSTSLPVGGEPKKKDQAWIAGAVVGPVVGLALLGALLWFCLAKRKKDKPPPAPQQPSMQQQAFQPGVPVPYNSPHQSYPPPSSTNSRPMSTTEYYNAQLANKPPGAPMPYGVAGHQSWGPPPQSPTSQASHSPVPVPVPHPPPSQSPQLIGSPTPVQPWQPNQIYSQPPPSSTSPPLQQSQQVYNQAPPASTSPPLQQAAPTSNYAGAEQAGGNGGPFSSEMDGSGYQSPQQQQQQQSSGHTYIAYRPPQPNMPPPQAQR